MPRGRWITLVAVGTALLSPSAHAAAMPVTPEANATTGSHPLFSWTLPANEQSDSIYLADDPATTPEGEFFGENVVDSDFFSNDEREWAPTTALPAGSYWWIVRSSDRDTYQGFYSAPSPFSIPTKLKVVSVKIERSSFIRVLYVTVRWRANVEALELRARILHGARLVWSARKRQQYHSIDEASETVLRFAAGRKLVKGPG